MKCVISLTQKWFSVKIISYKILIQYNSTSYLEKIKFNIEDINAKHTSITTIYRDNLNRKYLEK